MQAIADREVTVSERLKQAVCASCARLISMRNRCQRDGFRTANKVYFNFSSTLECMACCWANSIARDPYRARSANVSRSDLPSPYCLVTCWLCYAKAVRQATQGSRSRGTSPSRIASRGVCYLYL